MELTSFLVYLITKILKFIYFWFEVIIFFLRVLFLFTQRKIIQHKMQLRFMFLAVFSVEWVI